MFAGDTSTFDYDLSGHEDGLSTAGHLLSRPGNLFAKSGKVFSKPGQEVFRPGAAIPQRRAVAARRSFLARRPACHPSGLHPRNGAAAVPYAPPRTGMLRSLDRGGRARQPLGPQTSSHLFRTGISAHPSATFALIPVLCHSSDGLGRVGGLPRHKIRHSQAYSGLRLPKTHNS